MVLMVPQEKTFIIAEAGINHMGNLQVAKDLAYAAKEAGVDAVKFQTYDTDKRVSKDNAVYNILKQCELSYEQQAELIQYCKDIEIEFFSTPFDSGALSFLVNDQGLKRVKLASFDVSNTKFLEEVGSYMKQNPTLKVIMSVGMANHVEISNAIKLLGVPQYITLLHCISSYPTPDSDVNLLAIKRLSFIGGLGSVGYSDHTTGVHIPAMAVLVGATTIEKHFTLDKTNGAVDNPVSADPKMMKEMVDQIRFYEQLLGNGEVGLKEIEKSALPFRRVT